MQFFFLGFVANASLKSDIQICKILSIMPLSASG